LDNRIIIITTTTTRTLIITLRFWRRATPVTGLAKSVV
jgi:hypothetical protein